MEKILVILVLFAVIAVAIGSCSAMSQDTAQYAIDRTLDTVDRQPSAAELLLQSRQTAPAYANGGGNTLWIGVAIALIIIILLAAGLAYFIFGERWLKERRKYINAQKRAHKRPSAPQILPPPTADLPQIGNVPRVRQLPCQREDIDYGY